MQKGLTQQLSWRYVDVLYCGGCGGCCEGRKRGVLRDQQRWKAGKANWFRPPRHSRYRASGCPPDPIRKRSQNCISRSHSPRRTLPVRRRVSPAIGTAISQRTG